jgi:hypothetical protein
LKDFIQGDAEHGAEIVNQTATHCHLCRYLIGNHLYSKLRNRLR